MTKEKIKKAGRPRAKNSKYPFAGLGLDSREEELLQGILDAKDLSYRQVARVLIREWIREHKPRPT